MLVSSLNASLNQVLGCKITCEGSPGHGSKFIENNAGEKLQSVINSALAFRESEKKRMLENNLALGDVITLNLTIIEGGVQVNVLPEKLSVCRFFPKNCLEVVFQVLIFAYLQQLILTN